MTEEKVSALTAADRATFDRIGNFMMASRCLGDVMSAVCQPEEEEEEEENEVE